MAKHPFGLIPNLPPRPPAIAVDRMGKMIEPGHLILFHNNEDLVFEVVDVRPVLNPNMPPGTTAIQMRLKAEFPIEFLAAQAQSGLVIVGETRARAEARAANNGREQTPAIVLTDAPEDARAIDESLEARDTAEAKARLDDSDEVE